METWRADLIEKGKLRCREWEPDAMADLFWQQIIEAVKCLNRYLCPP
jgi:hypothetical protein